MSEPIPPAPPPSDSEPEPETTGVPTGAPTEAGTTATQDTSMYTPTPEPATVEAWSDEIEPIDRDPQTWRKTWVMAAILALAGIVVGAAVWFGHWAWPRSGQRDSHPAPAPASGPMPTTNAAAPPAPTSALAPAPPPTTVQASPSTVQTPQLPDVGISPEMIAWYDREFIANLKYNGARMTDPVVLTHEAHGVCAMLQKGATQDDVIQKIVAQSGWNYFTATIFVSTAMSTYPSCP